MEVDYEVKESPWVFQGSSQISPNSTSLRVSQANSYSPSPVLLHRVHDTYTSSSFESSGEEQHQQAAFIRPLPQGQTNTSAVLSPGDIDSSRIRIPNLPDDTPPIILDPPPRGRRSVHNNAVSNSSGVKNGNGIIKEQVEQAGASNSGVTRSQEGQKHLVHFLRTPGPPPSRTTSARLPSRSELMSQVQRTTWARHTTKWFNYMNHVT